MPKIDIHDKEDLYTQVKDYIKTHLQKGNYHPDDRIPTIREFAEMTRVSSLTVQRAVLSLVKEGVLYSRRRRGTFVRDIGAMAASPKQTGLYACMVPTIQSNTVAATVNTLDTLLFESSGQHLLLCNSQNDFDREVRMLDSLLDRTVDALVYQSNPLLYRNPIFVRAVDVRLQKFLAVGIPVVMLDDFAVRDRYDTILPDEVVTCELAVRHLLDLGHRRILFIGHGDLFKARIDAFDKITRAAGLGVQDARRVLTTNDNIEQGAIEALTRVLDDGWPFTGIVAATDIYALACHRYLKSQNIRCPENVSIVGADNLEFIQNTDIHVTTIWCDPVLVAQRVQQQIDLRRGQGDLRNTAPERIELPSQLLVRQSTSKPFTTPVQTNSIVS